MDDRFWDMLKDGLSRLWEEAKLPEIDATLQDDDYFYTVAEIDEAEDRLEVVRVIYKRAVELFPGIDEGMLALLKADKAAVPATDQPA